MKVDWLLLPCVTLLVDVAELALRIDFDICYADPHKPACGSLDFAWHLTPELSRSAQWQRLRVSVA